MREAGEVVAAQAPFAEYLSGWEGPWRYAAPEETEQLLHAAGFASAHCWLEPRPVRAPTTRAPTTATSSWAPTSAACRTNCTTPFIDAVFERLDDPAVIPYVRLNIDAVA